MSCPLPPGCSNSNAFFCNTIPPPTLVQQNAQARSQADGQQLRAAFLTEALWRPNDELKFGFLLDRSDSNLRIEPVPPNADPLAQVIVDMVKSATTPQQIKEAYKQSVIKIIKERFMPIINRNITFEDDVNNANIKVVFKNDLQSFAGVGRQVYSGTDAEDVHFGWWECGTIIHELGHVFAMIHEHQNPIGGVTLKWKRDLATEYFKCQGWDEEMINHNVFERIDSPVNGSYFDPLSVMLYNYPACLTENNVATKRNPRWSAYDVTWMANNYGGKSVSDTETAMGVLRETSQTMSAQDFFNKIYPDTPRIGDRDAYYSNIALSDAERVKFGGPLPPETKMCTSACGAGEICDFSSGKCVKFNPTDPTNPTQPTNPTNPTNPPTRPTNPTNPPTRPTNPTNPTNPPTRPTNPVNPVKPVQPVNPVHPCIGVGQCPVVCNSATTVNDYKAAYLPPVDPSFIAMSSRALPMQSLNSSYQMSTPVSVTAPQQSIMASSMDYIPPSTSSGLTRTVRLNFDESVPSNLITPDLSVPASVRVAYQPAPLMMSKAYGLQASSANDVSMPTMGAGSSSGVSSSKNGYLVIGSISALVLLFVFLSMCKPDKKSRR